MSFDATKNPLYNTGCDYPPKQRCLQPTHPGVQCAPLRCEDRFCHNLPQKPDFAVDHEQPIIVEWPPRQDAGQGDCLPDTGIRQDLLNMIPDHIVPQVVTVPAIPPPPPSQRTLETGVSPIQLAKYNHPLCPDGAMHMRITPPLPVKTEIRIPDMGCAVRQPKRRWRQCVENTLLNDRVRRPMARWCHKRPLPPLVIPCCEYERLLCKVTEIEREAAEKQERIKARECQRLESRRRMGEWNYTVESLLEKKKAKEEARQQAEEEGFDQLLKDIKNGRDRHSEEQTARANRQKMYRKGLIQDFHSAMAYSKMMQDMERIRQFSNQEEEDAKDATLPMCEQKCMKRMLASDDKPDYSEVRKPKKVNEKLLRKLQSIECRTKEQEREKQKEINAVKKLCEDNRPELPPAYLKHIKDPVCDEKSLQTKFFDRRDEFYQELDDKLAADAYVESHEKEVERQACEYRKYFIHQKFLRKETEQNLIKERVEKNIAKSNKAAAALVAAKAKKQKDPGQSYDALKAKWEEEYQQKDDEKKAHRARVMEAVTKNFLQNQHVLKCKWRYRDNHQLWASEVRCAEANLEKECDLSLSRRHKAKELQLFNRSLASEQKCRFERAKMIDNVWAEKMKGAYFEEMQDMKNYAQSCMREWTGKGRSTLPMHMSMKKWETDSQMDPRMFRQWEQKKACERAAQNAGNEDSDVFAEVIMTKHDPQLCQKPTETTQSTSRRLGFC